MKHLRLYENFNEFYKKLSTAEEREFFEARAGGQFTDRQIEDIKSRLSAFERAKNVNPYLAGRPGLPRFIMTWNAKEQLLITDENTLWHNRYIYIIPFDDEYFRAEIEPNQKGGTNWYLCDGFDGLIKFLDDLVVGKVES